MTVGIYSIASPSGRKYIGQSVNCERRMRSHQCALGQNRHHNSSLQRAYTKYSGSFTYKIECASMSEHLDELEQLVIDILGKQSYNQAAVLARGYRPDGDTEKRRSAYIAALKKDPTITLRQAVTAKKNYDADPLIAIRLSKAVKDSYAQDPSRKERLSASLKAAHLKDPTIVTRRKATDALTRKNDPTIDARRGLSIKAAYANDPSIRLRLSETNKARYANDPTARNRVGEARRLAYANDPTIRERQSAAHKLLIANNPSRVALQIHTLTKHKAHQRDLALVGNGLLLYSDKGLKNIYDAAYSQYRYKNEKMTSKGRAARNFLNSLKKSIVNGVGNGTA